MIEVLYNDAIKVAVLTVFGAPIMKCFARQVPFIIHAIVLFAVVFGVYFVYDVILAIASLFKFSPTSHTFYYALIGICPAIAWLITHTLAKAHGIGTKFPSVGARTMFVLVPLLTLISVVLVRFFRI